MRTGLRFTERAKRCTLDCVSPHKSRLDGLIRGPQIAFETLRASLLVKGGRVEILSNRSRSRISRVPDIHHELTGTSIRAQRFDTRCIRPVDGNPSHSKGTSRRRESPRSGARRLTISGNSCSRELAYDGYDKARYPDTRTSAYHLLIVSQCAQSKACVHYDLAGPDVQNFLFRGNMSSSQRFTT